MWSKSIPFELVENHGDGSKGGSAEQQWRRTTENQLMHIAPDIEGTELQPAASVTTTLAILSTSDPLSEKLSVTDKLVAFAASSQFLEHTFIQTGCATQHSACEALYPGGS